MFLFFDTVSNTYSALEMLQSWVQVQQIDNLLIYIPAVLHSLLVERPLAYVLAIDLYYVDLYFLFFFIFAHDISKTAEPIFIKFFRKMANGLKWKY